MNTILIYGNNKISAFLHTAFGESGLLTVDITQKINALDDPKDIYAVLDVSNAENSLDESSDLIHNTLEIKELIDLAHKVSAPYIFLYREREETRPESTIVTAMDLVKSYSVKKEVKYATVQIEDIYGPEINTSKKLEEFIASVTSGSNILTVDSDENEHYLMHQKDFKSGLKEIIKLLNAPNAKSKHYTLYPEDPITEIELAHFLKDLTDFDLEVVYTHDDIVSPHLPESEINYPENWWPDVDLKAGLEDLCDYSGIPMVDNADTELHNENFELAKDDSFTDNSNLSFDKNPETEIEPLDFYDREAKLTNTADFNDYEYDEEENHKSEDVVEKEEFEDYDYDYVDPTPKPAAKATKKRNPRKAIAGLVAVLLIALSLPSLTFAYNAGAGIVYLNRASENIQKLDLNSAYENSNKATIYLNKLEQIPMPVAFIAAKLGVSDKDQHLAVETTKEISLAINYLSGIDLYATFKNLDSHELAAGSDTDVLGASTVAAPEYIDKSLEKIEKVENNFETLETRNVFIRNLISQNINALNRNKDKLTKIRDIEPALSQLLGYKTPQTYLLLVQNLNVSRSSGGEVEVYGILKAENGQFTIEKLEKSADMHAQIELNGRIPAPEPIQAITGQDYLYMEDVTWDPDFRNASKTAMDLYSYIGNEKLDGVIAIDTNLLKTFIKTIGEIRVRDKVINEQNFTASLTKDQKADVIKDVFTYIFDTFKNNPESFKTLEPMIYSALNSRDMMVYHTDETTYSSIIENDWGGTLKGYQSDDFLYFANNNLTDIPSEKITSEIVYEGVLPTENEGYTRTVEIKYTNNGDSDYLDHLMAVVPGDTLINTAKLVTSNGEKNIARSVKSSVYGTKAMYETDLYIPTQQSVTIKIEYGSPLKAYKDKYMDITLQKQPGSGASPLSIKLDGGTNTNSNLLFDSDKELKFPL
jgi:hypothetical protein